jgi:hypothetical protein
MVINKKLKLIVFSQYKVVSVRRCMNNVHWMDCIKSCRLFTCCISSNTMDKVKSILFLSYFHSRIH